MKVLVTGASGFLGGALTKKLIEYGYNVRVLVRQGSKIQHLQQLPVEIVYGCLEDQESLRAAVKDIKIVYHCAAVSTDWAPWEQYYRANVEGVRNLLEAAVTAGTIKRFLHVSTTDVYGYPAKPCDETAPIKDIGLPYNRTKGNGENVVWDYQTNNKIPVTIIRPVTIYGPGSKDFAVELAAMLLGNQMIYINGGRSPAGLLYIDNAVEGIIQASVSPHTIGQAYNLRDYTTETWQEYIEALSAGLNAKTPAFNIPAGIASGIGHIFEQIYKMAGIKSRPLLTRHAVYLLSKDQSYPINKAVQDFGYQPKINFREGVELTLEWLHSPDGKRALEK